jgi:hypothetical protein
MKAKERGRIDALPDGESRINPPLSLGSHAAQLVIFLEPEHKILQRARSVLVTMLKFLAALAIRATLCLNSPVRESKNGSDEALQVATPSSSSARTDLLTGLAAKAALSRVAEPISPETAAALARQGAAAGAQALRKAVAAPASPEPPVRR